MKIDEIEVEVLEESIMHKKQELILLFEKKGSLTDSCVIALSQELDVLVVKSQRIKVKSLV